MTRVAGVCASALVERSMVRRRWQDMSVAGVCASALVERSMVRRRWQDMTSVAGVCASALVERLTFIPPTKHFMQCRRGLRLGLS